MKVTTYAWIARTLIALKNCEKEGKTEWAAKHRRTLLYIADNHLPSGSGIDGGCKIDADASTPNKIVIRMSFHHMNEHGYYSGWTDHTVTVTPSLPFGIDIKISGRDRKQIKDYLYEVFHGDLTMELEPVWRPGEEPALVPARP